jgi:hypothetical protein
MLDGGFVFCFCFVLGFLFIFWYQKVILYNPQGKKWPQGQKSYLKVNHFSVENINQRSNFYIEKYPRQNSTEVTFHLYTGTHVPQWDSNHGRKESFT